MSTILSLINVNANVPIKFGKKIQICYQFTDRKDDEGHVKRFRIFRAYNKSNKPLSLQFYGIRIHGSNEGFVVNSKTDLKQYEFLPSGAVTKGYEYADGDIIAFFNLKKDKNGEYSLPTFDVAFIEPNGKLYTQKIKL